jgi:hypothetical protein
MNTLKHKRGTTFRKEGQLVSGVTPVDLTDANLHSAMVWPDGTRADLTVEVVDAEEGRYSVTASHSSQANWPLGPAVWDVVFVFPDRVEATRTYRIEIEKEVTIGPEAYVPPDP